MTTPQPSQPSQPEALRLADELLVLAGMTYPGDQRAVLYEAESELRRLHAEVDRISGLARGHIRRAANFEDERDRLKAENEALRNAANRWQYFRAQVHGVRDKNGIEEFGLPVIKPCVATIMRGSVAQHFDCAVDAAMGREGGA